MKCPVCSKAMEGEGEKWYCGACHVRVNMTSDLGKEAHATFCREFREHTENPRPGPRREEP